MKGNLSGVGEAIELCLLEARVVAVETSPAAMWGHCYSILVGKYFLATKNFSRKTWVGCLPAQKALESLYKNQNILVTKNLLGGAKFRTIEQGWTLYDVPKYKYHKIEFYENNYNK